MKALRLRAENFRNIEHADIEFSPTVNIFCGNNGEGKTNLLEALWMFTGAKSFRGAKNTEMIKFGEKKANLTLDFNSHERDQRAEMLVRTDTRIVTLNDVPDLVPGNLIGSLCAVVFAPEHIKLVSGGAEGRRSFIDCSICQMKPSFTNAIVRYTKVLRQRNALLKQIKENVAEGSLLSIWDDHLSQLGAHIAVTRYRYLQQLSEKSAAIYSGISDGREIFDAKYACSFFRHAGDCEEDYQYALLKKLQEGRGSDLTLGFTYYGPHRDDIDIRLDSMPVRQFGSQGQKKSCVLALKLGEAEMMSRTAGEMPIAILDDVLSELDTSRQKFLLSKLDGWQVMITCCDKDTLKKVTKGKIFEVENGVFSSK